MSMLEVSDLSAGYGAIPVLYGISMRIEAGESIGILGHNGMGKTTLLRCLIGALKTSAGSVKFLDQELTGLAPNARAKRGMAYVPQGREIFPTLSVMDNLRMGMIKTGEKSMAPIEAMLDYFPRLKPLLDRNGGSLSGGEQQLLALARALAGKPTLLLLDEPTEGIQPSIIEEIAETLATLRDKTGLTIVLVEQNLDFIASVSQRVLVIKRGQLGEEIPAEHLHDLEIMSKYAGVH
ncbi:MAG: transporter ATP-binding protein [Rhizobacter sp.]|nr:transporter ATP-binding protein [Rhizobacter sp.]